MFHIAVCDDSKQEAEVILALLNKYQTVRLGHKMHLHSFYTGEELLNSVKAGQTFDLFLLDILMPDLDGIELARKLKALNEDIPLVFLTSSSKYALDAFSVQATQYILKPIRADNLFPVLDKIIFIQRRKQDDFLLVSIPNSKVKVPFSSITCVESVCRKLLVYLTDGSKLLSNSIRSPFTTAIASLLNDSRFLYAHKSYILNMEYVKELTGSLFVMKDGIIVPVPRYKFAEAKNKYLNYLSKREIDY